jgi:hypothetical protein
MIEEKENISIPINSNAEMNRINDPMVRDNIYTFIGIDIGKYFIDVYCSLNNITFFKYISLFFSYGNKQITLITIIRSLRKWF